MALRLPPELFEPCRKLPPHRASLARQAKFPRLQTYTHNVIPEEPVAWKAETFQATGGIPYSHLKNFTDNNTHTTAIAAMTAIGVT